MNYFKMSRVDKHKIGGKITYVDKKEGDIYGS